MGSLIDSRECDLVPEMGEHLKRDAPFWQRSIPLDTLDFVREAVLQLISSGEEILIQESKFFIFWRGNGAVVLDFIREST